MNATTKEVIPATRAEVAAWFFEDYLPRWVAAAQGAEGPEFIHGYWGTPLHVTGLEQSFWCLDDASVLAFLDFNYAPLRESGYSHTVVPDRRIFVYSPVGAAIEVIWSRRSAEDVEIQRWATHFEVAKSDQGWRVIGIQATATDKDSLDEIWSRESAAVTDA